MALSWFFTDMYKAVKTLNLLTCVCNLGGASLSLLLVSAQTVNKCPFHGLFSTKFFIFFYFSLLKMVLEYSVEVLSAVPEHWKAVIYIMEKSCVLDKLRSGVSHSAVDLEFSVNESTEDIKNMTLNKNTHKARLCIDWFLNRNTQKTRLCIDRLMKIL